MILWRPSCTPQQVNLFEYSSIRDRDLWASIDWELAGALTTTQSSYQAQLVLIAQGVIPGTECPLGVTSAYISGTLFAACTCPTTHQVGMTIFLEDSFHKQIFTLLEPGLRSQYVLVATTSLEKPCSLGSVITWTCLT